MVSARRVLTEGMVSELTVEAVTDCESVIELSFDSSDTSVITRRLIRPSVSTTGVKLSEIPNFLNEIEVVQTIGLVREVLLPQREVPVAAAGGIVEARIPDGVRALVRHLRVRALEELVVVPDAVDLQSQAAAGERELVAPVPVHAHARRQRELGLDETAEHGRYGVHLRIEQRQPQAEVPTLSRYEGEFHFAAVRAGIRVRHLRRQTREGEDLIVVVVVVENGSVEVGESAGERSQYLHILGRAHPATEDG